MRTDHELFFNNTTVHGNFTAPITLDFVNGTGRLTDGYVSSVAYVPGLDLILEVLIVQMILQVFILAAVYHISTKVNAK